MVRTLRRYQRYPKLHIFTLARRLNFLQIRETFVAELLSLSFR